MKRSFFTPGKNSLFDCYPFPCPERISTEYSWGQLLPVFYRTFLCSCFFLAQSLWLLHDINSVFSNVFICFLVEPRCLQHITRKQCILSPGDHLALKKVFLVISTYAHPAAVSLENSKIGARSGETFSEKMKGLSCITCFSFLRSEITNLTIACLHLSILSNRAHSTHS